jgi:hypothetical protein
MNDASGGGAHEPDRPQNLEDLLAELEGTVDRESETTVGELHEAIGKRSFGPLLVAVGLAGVTPLAGVPSVPSMLALCTILVAAQLLVGRKSFWLPKWFLRRPVKRPTIRRSVRLARPPARFVDRLIRPSLEFFTGPFAERLVAAVCVLIALAVPPLELLPLAAALPSLAILAFGLGLTARDGLLVVIALAISGVSLFFVGQKLLG